MITKFKIFENSVDNNIIKVNLNDIIHQSPWFGKRMGNKYNSNVKKDYSFIINKLEDLFLNKYVNFENSEYFNSVYTTRLFHGIVEEVMYDNEWGDKSIYFKLKGDEYFYDVDIDSIVQINLALSDAAKYNL